MPKIMLIDAAQPEETRVVVINNGRLEAFDIESYARKQLKGNIYLAKVTRVEPSLQAAFVSYGGNRHGFLPFSEIHPDYYRIPVADRERLLAEQEELRREMREEAEREEREYNARLDAESIEQPLDNDAQVEAIERLDSESNTNGSDDDALDIISLPSALDRAMNDEDGSFAVQPDADFEADDGDSEGDDDDTHADNEPNIFSDGDEPHDAETSESQTEQGDVPAAEGDENRGGRGRGRGRFRGRGRNNRRGGGNRQALDRAPEQIIDRSADTSEDDDTGATPLWKRMRRSYKIQEVIKRGQIMLIQVVKEERGNKGAAVTSYITMPGRYCVLMPNSPQSGGVSRKIATHTDRRKMRELLDELTVPDGMSVILRTAGVDRGPDEVKRDLDYLMRLWDNIREKTMQSSAPALIHEEGSLVKRAIRDIYNTEIDQIIVEGDAGVDMAKDVMELMMPGHAKRVQRYRDTVPLFLKYGAEAQIDAIHSHIVTLKSGGSIVINPTEALVSIDINSGRATRERHIEETAFKTNMEAAEEIARQLRLRDLGGLIVIDFIDMESRRNNAQVEKRLRDALASDRARVQVGRISNFGLLELSRQRLRPSLTETHFQTCPHCRGMGIVRTTEATALMVMRAIEGAGIEGRASEILVNLRDDIAMFLFNAKRGNLAALEARYNMHVTLKIVPVIEDEQGFKIEIVQTRRAERVAVAGQPVLIEGDLEDTDDDVSDESESTAGITEHKGQPDDDRGGRGRRRRGRRGGRGRFRDRDENAQGVDAVPSEAGNDNDVGNQTVDAAADIPEEGLNSDETDTAQTSDRPRRRRARGGRGRNRDGVNTGDTQTDMQEQPRTQQPAQVPSQMPEAPPSKPQAPQVEASAPVVRDYEVVNPETGEKKKGWWKKLTG